MAKPPPEPPKLTFLGQPQPHRPTPVQQPSKPITPNEPIDPDRPERFPSIMLLVPAVFGLLFAAGTEPLVEATKSVNLAILVSAASAIVAIACFATLGVRAKNQEFKVAAAVGVGASLLVFATGLLQVI